MVNHLKGPQNLKVPSSRALTGSVLGLVNYTFWVDTMNIGAWALRERALRTARASIISVLRPHIPEMAIVSKISNMPRNELAR